MDNAGVMTLFTSTCMSSFPWAVFFSTLSFICCSQFNLSQIFEKQYYKKCAVVFSDGVTQSWQVLPQVVISPVHYLNHLFKHLELQLIRTAIIGTDCYFEIIESWMLPMTEHIQNGYVLKAICQALGWNLIQMKQGFKTEIM